MENQNKEVSTKITSVSAYSGPLPPPDALIKYNQATPNAAERIISMAEKEMMHRHKKEDETLRERNRLAFISIVFSFISVILGQPIFPVHEVVSLNKN